MKTKITLIGLLMCIAMIPGMTHAQANKPLIWKVSGKDLTKPIYIYTTNSSCNEGAMEDERLRGILKTIDEVVVEANLYSKKNISKFPTLITATADSQRLRNVVSVGIYQQIAAMAKDNYNYSEQIINQFKPFYINAFLLKDLSPCPSNGTPVTVENEIEDFCDKSGKKYTEIQTPEKCFHTYDSLPTSYWKANIEYVFKNQDEVKIALQVRSSLYDTNKIADLENFLAANTYFKIRYPKEVVYDYNKDILNRLFASHTSSSVMVVLDINYFLATEASLYKQLVGKGYTVQLL